MPKQIKSIAVIFGGKSAEHEVSIITGQLVISELRKMQYQVVPVYISRVGKWYAGDDLGSLKFFTSPSFEEVLAKRAPSVLDINAQKQFVLISRKGFSQKIHGAELVFPAMHGTYGEDGTLQGLLEMIGVPYVGCDTASSAVSMDKSLTKLFFRALNIPTTAFIALHKRTVDIANLETKIASLSWPLFVKPVHLGSSIGMTKVADMRALRQAIEVAFHYDTKIVVEEGVDNVMDITCAAMGYGNVTVSEVQQTLYSADHLSYEDKYLTDGGTQTGQATNNVVIPAPLTPEQTDLVKRSTAQIYEALGCSGIARVDYLLNPQTQEIFANEINPMPGTLYHHLWKASGYELSAVLEQLIDSALVRHNDTSAITTSFGSDVLTFANSIKLRINE